MARIVGWALVAVMAGGGVAHAKDAGAGGWGAVERLKPGTKVVVEELSTPGDYRYQVPCEVVRVDDASLTCRPEGQRNRRIVYPAGQVLTVYRVKMRVTAGSWVRMVIFPGLGFLLGCAITDENPDYPLGALGAVAGGALGAEHISKGPKFEVVYWRTETPVGGTVSP
jgi:hypothetical protein